MRAPRTLLYVPADRPDRVRKALASAADVVLVDLEDAVAAPAKEVARSGLAELLRTSERSGRGAVQVRINAVGTPWFRDDVGAVTSLPVGVGVRVPKCEEPAAVADLVVRMAGRAVHLLVESARGVEAAYDLARVPGVATIGLGEADLRADLGVSDDAGLAWARSRVVNAAAAARLPAPAMSVWTDVADLDGLRESCGSGRRQGFRGRAALHPKQLPVIDEAFRPTAHELDQARQVLAAIGGAAESGGAFLLPDGRFVDEAVVRQARRTVETG